WDDGPALILALAPLREAQNDWCGRATMARSLSVTLPESAIHQPACPACGRTTGPDDRFCGHCGAALPVTCRRCGRTVSGDLAYCTGGGQRLRASGPDEPEAAMAREERRRVSVLFVDAVGSTPFTERADPENVRALQTEYFATVRRVVHQYGGVVEKYIGDA